ncbi:predicted protein [Histoplasma capsulatum G186AR]|uniref:Uncharacterized protein n=1 Tax=Ajellomyces capsulatus (strain G186AR / H82 / ATCC MYA-2454 / RMSCC 2432) TaxID=447093 RepID=C0NIV1_AJECG|nr:uncharacterized protein HCBG_02358 [Histoplasma capsulatum G186AR]EEH08821.1 predicted protein [Histoplasma capsulatum G186AR]
MVVGSGDKSNVAELSFRRRLHPNMLLGCKKSAPAQVPLSPVVAISNNEGEVYINGATATNSSLQVKGNRSRVVMRAQADNSICVSMPLGITSQESSQNDGSS